MKSVLIFHVYIKNNWKDVSSRILENVPHDDVVVNVSVDWFKLIALPLFINFFKRNSKVKKVTYTINNKKYPEALGFNKLRWSFDTKKYKILTYAHAKGVSKVSNRNIQDWVELMRYFVIERLDLAMNAFNDGYLLFGVNLGSYLQGSNRSGPYQFSDFHYSGNFVSINLEVLRDKFFNTPCDFDYFGVEGFWGKLTTIDKAYCAHMSSVNIDSHYTEPYPEKFYKN